MGNKIFISYKYGDTDVAPVPGYSSPKVRNYVSWLEEKFTNRTAHYYKGEHDDEDLSGYSDDYIWDKLKDKIYDSSTTIVLISPNMKIPYKHQKSQWIPWEISYSLRRTTRNDRTSQRNAILAVVLPDKNGKYDYYRNLTMFGILQDNIGNGYIPTVTWGDFKYDCDRYITNAHKRKNETPEYKLTISL